MTARQVKARAKVRGDAQTIADETSRTLVQALAALSAGPDGRLFFPNGIELIELELEVAGAKARVRIAGASTPAPSGVVDAHAPLDLSLDEVSRPRTRAIDEAVVHEGTGTGHAPKPPVKWIASPNHAARAGKDIDTLILHNTDGSLSSAVNRFRDPAAQVSAHYIVDRTGEIVQMVRDDDVAWHAGKKETNMRSIGIEIVAWKAALRMTVPQEETLTRLCKFVIDAYSIPLDRVKPHRSIKPTECPGWIWKTDEELAAWKKAKLA